jgi:hypothetical protein
MSEKEKPKPEQTHGALLRAGSLLPNSHPLQKDTEVQYAVRGGKKVIVGPEGLRPAILLGSEIK